MVASKVRRARHAGSWYEDDEETLDQQLQGWLDSVDVRQIPSSSTSVVQVGLPGWTPSDEDNISLLPLHECKAIIAPHAGYSYSGPAAAYAYKCIDPSKFNRVFILGPSHKIYLSGCALSTCETYETPIGDLPLDRETIKELEATKEFVEKVMTLDVDENEHSIEMHLPYIRKVFKGKKISIVPILVGALSLAQETSMGRILMPYLKDEKTLFVVSSDFCHWGSRFDYTHYKPDSSTKMRSLHSRDSITSSMAPIHASIRALDGTAISHLTFPSTVPVPDASRLHSAEATNTQAADRTKTAKTAKQAQTDFHAYLRETKNTICGRHPIGVLLGALAALEEEYGSKMEVRFTRYEQSSECTNVRDSSVSYASAFVRYKF